MLHHSLNILLLEKLVRIQGKLRPLHLKRFQIKLYNTYNSELNLERAFKIYTIRIEPLSLYFHRGIKHRTLAFMNLSNIHCIQNIRSIALHVTIVSLLMFELQLKGGLWLLSFDNWLQLIKMSFKEPQRVGEIEKRGGIESGDG